MFAHAQFKRKYTRDLLVDNDLHLSYQNSVSELHSKTPML